MLIVALVWQITTFLIPMGLVLHMWWSVVPACVLWIALGWFLLRDKVAG